MHGSTYSSTVPGMVAMKREYGRIWCIIFAAWSRWSLQTSACVVQVSLGARASRQESWQWSSTCCFCQPLLPEL